MQCTLWLRLHLFSSLFSDARIEPCEPQGKKQTNKKKLSDPSSHYSAFHSLTRLAKASLVLSSAFGVLYISINMFLCSHCSRVSAMRATVTVCHSRLTHTVTLVLCFLFIHVYFIFYFLSQNMVESLFGIFSYLFSLLRFRRECAIV